MITITDPGRAPAPKDALPPLHLLALMTVLEGVIEEPGAGVGAGVGAGKGEGGEGVRAPPLARIKCLKTSK